MKEKPNDGYTFLGALFLTVAKATKVVSVHFCIYNSNSYLNKRTPVNSTSKFREGSEALLRITCLNAFT